MSYKGGSVLFRNSVATPQEMEQQILKILELTTSIEVVAEQENNNGVIYKLTFAEGIGDYLFGLPLNPARDVPTYVPPRMLIIKYTYDRIDNPDFRIEARTHFDIASADKRENVFPISPSYIFSQIIQQSLQQFTTIGEAFYQLLTIHNLRERLDTFIRKLRLPYDRTDYKQTIIIMEMIDGITLFRGLEQLQSSLSIVDRQFSFTINKTFLENFYTFYLLTLLAEKGYSHGDPHSGNIMLVSTTGNPFFLNAFGDLLTKNGLNVVPYIIDFGKAAPLFKLVFEPFTSKQLSNADFQRFAAFYIEVYNNALRLLTTKTIEDIVSDLIKNQHLYVQAILILTMCRYKHPSMFKMAQDENNKLYNSFFYMTRENADALNILIREAINDRKLLETELKKWQTQPEEKEITHTEEKEITQTDKRQRLEGGHYRNKKTRTKNYNKLHKKKINNTRKLKKLKTRKIRKTRKTRKTRN